MQVLWYCLASFVPLICWMLYSRRARSLSWRLLLGFAFFGILAVFPAYLFTTVVLSAVAQRALSLPIVEELFKFAAIFLAGQLFNTGTARNVSAAPAVGAALAFAGFESLVYAAAAPVLLLYRALTAVLFHGCTGVFCARAAQLPEAAAPQQSLAVRAARRFWPLVLGIALHILYNAALTHPVFSVPLALPVLLTALAAARVLYF